MYQSIAAALAFAAAVSATPAGMIEPREEVDTQAVCESMYAQEGDCRFVSMIVTTGIGLTLSGSPAVGSPVPAPAVGFYEDARMGYLFDHDCNVLEAGEWNTNKGWEIQFVENEYHDYIHAFEYSLGIDNIDPPMMSTGETNPLTPICDDKKSVMNGLNAGWYKVCVFHCTGGLQKTG